MSTSKIIFLDAQTKGEEQRVTSFGDSLTEVIKDFMGWVKELELSQEDMWYADIFIKEDKCIPKHFASIEIKENGEFMIIPAPEDSRVNPYKRKKSMLEKLHLRRNSA